MHYLVMLRRARRLTLVAYALEPFCDTMRRTAQAHKAQTRCYRELRNVAGMAIVFLDRRCKLCATARGRRRRRSSSTSQISAPMAMPSTRRVNDWRFSSSPEPWTPHKTGKSRKMPKKGNDMPCLEFFNALQERQRWTCFSLTSQQGFKARSRMWTEPNSPLSFPRQKFCPSLRGSISKKSANGRETYLRGQ
jgi:hypothetical protein